jgi:hypothetical protein
LSIPNRKCKGAGIISRPFFSVEILLTVPGREKIATAERAIDLVRGKLALVDRRTRIGAIGLASGGLIEMKGSAKMPPSGRGTKGSFLSRLPFAFAQGKKPCPDDNHL